jgi:hypothetical protein
MILSCQAEYPQFKEKTSGCRKTRKKNSDFRHFSAFGFQKSADIVFFVSVFLGEPRW